MKDAMGNQKTFKNNPVGRIGRFLCEHEGEINDFGGMFSSGPTTSAIAPFFVKYMDELTKLAQPQESDNDEYVE